MSVPQPTSPVLGLGAFGLLVGVDPHHRLRGGASRPPGRWALRRAVERIGQPDQPVVGSRSRLRAGDGPGRRTQQGRAAGLCGGVAGARGWTLVLFAAALTETAVIWEGSVSGVRYGTDSPTGGVDDSPNATLLADGSLILDDR
jgi:hypothetical protein